MEEKDINLTETEEVVEEPAKNSLKKEILEWVQAIVIAVVLTSSFRGRSPRWGN